MLVFIELLKNIDDDTEQNILPSDSVLLQIAISFLNPQNRKYSEYSDDEREFIARLKKHISGRQSKKEDMEDRIVCFEDKIDKRNTTKGE